MSAEELAPVTDLLAFQPMPKLAEALLTQKVRIIARWNHLVKQLLPDADDLTAAQVRNSIPTVLERMADALEASDQRPTDELMEATRLHGVVRFHESYNVKELIAEYRILRRVLVEEVDQAYNGTVSTREWIALDIAVDIALQQAVISFLEHQRAQLKSSTEAEAKFLSFLSHDMRNSLNSILLNIQWAEASMRAHADLAEEADGLRTSREAAQQTITSMERLLQAERLRKGVAVRREKISLHQLAAMAIATSRPAAESKGLRLTTEAPAEAYIESDAGLLMLILENLLGNAIKYTTRGSVTLAVTMIDDAQGPGCELAVRDTGNGISQQHLATLFEAFKRGETHGQPGVGLGLFIAAQAARILDTRLQVESERGKGSTFRFIVRNLPHDV